MDLRKAKADARKSSKRNSSPNYHADSSSDRASNKSDRKFRPKSHSITGDEKPSLTSNSPLLNFFSPKASPRPDERANSPRNSTSSPRAYSRVPTQAKLDSFNSSSPEEDDKSSLPSSFSLTTSLNKRFSQKSSSRSPRNSLGSPKINSLVLIQAESESIIALRRNFEAEKVYKMVRALKL